MQSQGEKKLDIESYDFPFHHKKHITLNKVRKNYSQTIVKHIQVPCSERCTFDYVWAKVQSFSKAIQRRQSIINLKGLSLEVQEGKETICYKISRPLLKGKSLQQLLLDNHEGVKISKQLVNELVNLYARNINLNHIVCSSNNLYATQNSKQQIKLHFNYTSIAFILNVYRCKQMWREDLLQYANYLTASFLKEQIIDKRFNFQLKVRSLAVNLLSITLQRHISFFKVYSLNENCYNQQQVKQILLKTQACFQELLQDQQTIKKISQVSADLNIDLMKFFNVFLLSSDSNRPCFASWGKIIEFFNTSFMCPYLHIFQLQFQMEYREIFIKPTGKSYLQSWLQRKWDHQQHSIQEQFVFLGIVNDLGKRDMVLYLLYRYNLLSTPIFQLANQSHHPQFLKSVLLMYSQIIESSLILEGSFVNPKSQKIHKRNSFIGEVVTKISKRLNEFCYKADQFSKSSINYYMAKQCIDFGEMHDIVWRVG